MLISWSHSYLPEYGFLARAHDAAINNGTASGLVVPVIPV